MDTPLLHPDVERLTNLGIVKYIDGKPSMLIVETPTAEAQFSIEMARDIDRPSP